MYNYTAGAFNFLVSNSNTLDESDMFVVKLFFYPTEPETKNLKTSAIQYTHRKKYKVDILFTIYPFVHPFSEIYS